MNLRHLLQRVINLPLRLFNLEIRRIIASPAEEVPAEIEPIGAPPPEPEIDLKPYYWLIKQNIKTVLDIGANTGQFATLIHQILPNTNIISFEPLKDCYKELLKNGTSLCDFKAYNYALGDKKGEAPIYRSEFSPSSSLLQMGALHKAAFPFTKRGTVEKIQVKKLDEVKDLDISFPMLVKIDVQGLEDKVIKGGKKTISKAQVLIVETSFQTLYKDQPLFDKIYMQLKELGFAYHGNWFQDNDMRDGAALQSDAIFIKTKSTNKKTTK